MSHNTWLLAGLAWSALLASCTGSAPGTRDADVAALKEVEAGWVRDAATKDVEKWMAHYTDETAVLIPGSPTLTGKQAIRAALKPMLTDPNFTVTFGATKIDVARSGDLAYTRGTYTMTATDPKTKAPTTEKGKYLTVYRKQAGGTWKAVEDTFMSDAPPPGETGK